jgi:hypothetical protein
MKKEIEINEWIESYLSGNLQEDEMNVFRSRMKEDPSFAKEVDMHKQIHQIIEDGTYIHIRNELKAIHLQNIKFFNSFRRLSFFAMGGLIVGLIMFFILKNRNETNEINGKTIDKPLQHASADTLTESKKIIPSNSPVENNKIQSQSVMPVTGEPGNVLNNAGINQKVNEDQSIFINHKPGPDTHTPDVKPVNTDNSSDNQHISDHSTAPPETENIINPDCDQVKIEAVIIENESCNNKPTGSLTIDGQTISGGQPPYAFSLDKIRFYDTLVFSALYPGNYSVYVKDGNECTGRIGVARIGSTDCNYQAVFAPMKGETWTVPADPNKEGTLQIFSKAGLLVFTSRISENETILWNGETFNGGQLPMGIYLFEIRYSDGSIFSGTVTILK